MAESYDASSSNSDSLSMTIPPSIDRSSIPEESYLAESKWWWLIRDSIKKRKEKIVRCFWNEENLFHFRLRGRERKGKGDRLKKYFRADGKK